MRMRLPQVEEELWQIITGKAPLRTPKGMVVTDQDGTPVMDYAARPRDRAYATSSISSTAWPASCRRRC